MKRRTFLKGALASAAALSVLPGFAEARAKSGGWLTGVGTAEGGYGAVHIADDLTLTPVLTSSQRLHDILVRPHHTDVSAPARRPGVHIWVARADGETLVIDAPQDRHYFGHGVYSHDGATLYTAENDFDGERGVIGIYDANDGYKRLGEFDANGIGPHQMRLLPDGRHMVIANGGILTHPDLGRAKLNIDTMQPNLTVIDLHSQKVVDQAQLKPAYHQLSLRHFDLTPSGEVVFGIQDQVKPYGDHPMVGAWMPGSAPRLFGEPENGWQSLNGYVGSMALDLSGRTAAAASPRGGAVEFFDVASGEPTGAHLMSDICGVSATRTPGSFIVTSGQGEITVLDVAGPFKVLNNTTSAKLSFDNHCHLA